MDERKIDLVAPLFVAWLKSLPMNYECEYDSGNYYGSMIDFHGIGSGSTIDEMKSALIHDVRDWADVFYEDFGRWRKGRDNQVPVLLKVLVSSDEELLSCLNCVNSENI